MRTIKGKISLIYVGLVFFIAIVGVVGIFNLYITEVAVDNIIADDFSNIHSTVDILEVVEKENQAILIYIGIDKNKGNERFEQENSNFKNWYKTQLDKPNQFRKRELMVNIENSYNKYANIFEDLKKVYNEQGKDKAVEFYQKDVSNLFENLKKQLRNLNISNEAEILKNKENTVFASKRSVNILLVMSLLMVVIGYFGSSYCISMILKPLKSLSDRISKVKAGEVSQKLEVKSKDEIGNLSNEFNQMINRLREYECSTMGTLMIEKNKSVAILKSISDPLLVLDVNYSIVLINNACEKFFDVEESKVIGKHFLEVIRNSQIFDCIVNSKNSEKEKHEQSVILEKEEIYYFNVNVTKVKELETENLSLIVILRDITEMKELEKVKTDFVATISHEFKTPLTSILMASSMILEGGMGKLNVEQNETMETVKEESEKLAGLVNELLELSKIESGRAVYNIETCSINAVIETAIKSFFEMAQKLEVELDVDLDEGLLLVDADFGKIHWVLNNLISNALKYTNAGDFITISSKRDKKYVYVSVKDTGAGIPHEYLERIFDKFVQVNGRDIEVRGTGLGLSVSREIIKAHKGEIWAKSELDAGSEFTFKLHASKVGRG